MVGGDLDGPSRQKEIICYTYNETISIHMHNDREHKTICKYAIESHIWETFSDRHLAYYTLVFTCIMTEIHC